MNKLGAVIVGMAVLATIAIVLSITLTADTHRNEPDDQPFISDGEPITFREALSGVFGAKSFNGTWWSDNEIQWEDTEGNLVLWNVETNQTSILVGSNTVGSVSKTASFEGFSPSNEKLLLFSDKSESIWRHSKLSEYIVLDSSTNTTIKITPKGASPDAKLSYARWVPQSSFLVYVYLNNIFVRTVLNDPDSDVAITSDGVKDTIYNGIPDWVYEEEILATNHALYFSESGTKMAFCQFNDTEVEEFYYTKYGDPGDPYKVQYPQQIMLKYPKVGTTNPTVQFYVSSFDASGKLNQTKPLTHPDDVPEEHLYQAANWIDDNTLSIIWTNRVQNESSVSTCLDQGSSWKCTSVTNPVQSGGWLRVGQNPVYRSDGKAFLQILPLKVTTSSGRDLHYAHIKLRNDLQEAYYITNGEIVVQEILKWDEEGQKVYFMATGENDPTSTHFYSASTGSNVDIKCISCDLKTQRGHTCKSNTIQLSNEATYYVHTCSGPGIPEVVLRSTSDHQVKYIFELNESLESRLEAKAVSERMDLTLTVGSNYKAPVVLKLPKGYDPNQKYPLLVYVYGGPESQSVNQRFSVGWTDYLTSNYGIVYAIIDGRGTAGQSDEYMFEAYRKLGTVEMEDQIEGVKQLLAKFAFLDPDRVGINGWSYGGYATAMTLIKDSGNVFKCGISTAPPTNWLYYDSLYTERYMGLPTPEDNMVGYNDSSLLDKVDHLRGKMFQLNHGVADDNVHYQQSMLFIRALELQNVPFEQNSYPDENHGIGGLRTAIYTNFDEFLAQCFGHQLAT